MTKLLLALFGLVSCLECDSFTLGNKTFSLTLLNKLTVITLEKQTPPSTQNTTIYLNPCASLLSFDTIDKCFQTGKPFVKICQQIINKKDGEPDRIIQAIPGGGDLTTPSLKNDNLVLNFAGSTYNSKDQFTTIEFTCGVVETPPTFESYTDEKTLLLKWTTKAACAIEGKIVPVVPAAKGVGKIAAFFFWLFVAFLVYFVVGCLYHITVLKITKFPEFIPNFVFWCVVLNAGLDGVFWCKSKVMGGATYVRI